MEWLCNLLQLEELPISLQVLRRWSIGANDYRLMEKRLPNGPRLSLLLDITHHQHFLQQMQRLIWLCVGLSALATARLGAWVARRGLRPLRNMRAVAQQVSASSLTTRLPTQGLPAELSDLAQPSTPC